MIKVKFQWLTIDLLIFEETLFTQLSNFHSSAEQNSDEWICSSWQPTRTKKRGQNVTIWFVDIWWEKSYFWVKTRTRYKWQQWLWLAPIWYTWMSAINCHINLSTSLSEKKTLAVIKIHMTFVAITLRHPGNLFKICLWAKNQKDSVRNCHCLRSLFQTRLQ